MTELKTLGDYMHAIRVGNYETWQREKTQKWNIFSRREAPLGVIKWWGPWRQYCYFPDDSTTLSGGCLTEITKFIGALMLERRTHTEAGK